MGERAELGSSESLHRRSWFQTHLLRNSVFLLARSFLSYGLGFVFWLLVARSYSASDVGLGVVLLSTLLLLARAAALGLPTGLLRYLPCERDKVGLINGAFTVSGVSSSVIGVLFLAGLVVWAPVLSFVNRDPLIASVFVLSLVFFTLDGVVDNAFVAVRRSDYGLVRSTIFYTLRLPLAFLFAGFGLFGILFSWTASLIVSVLGMAFLLPRFYSGYRPVPSLKPIRETGILGFSVWNYATGLVSGASVFLLPLLVVNVLGGQAGAEQSAYFYSAYSLASLLYVVPSAFSTALLVEGSHSHDTYQSNTREALRLSLLLLVLGIAAASLLGRQILGLFGGVYAREGYDTLLLLSFASPIVLATSILTTHLQVAKRVRPMFVINSITSSATLLLAFVLVGAIGIFGVALAFMLGQSLMAVLYLAEARVHKGKSPSSAAAE